MSRLMRNAWLPLLIVAVVVVGGFTVLRVKSFFGAQDPAVMTSPRMDDSKPFKPKVVKYEIFGSASHANVNYLDLNAKPQRVDGAPLPWTLGPQHDRPLGLPEHLGTERRRFPRLPHHRR